MKLELDAIYWLHPQDKNESIRVMGGGENHGNMQRSSPTIAMIPLPESVIKAQGPDVGMTWLKSLRAFATKDGWACSISLPPVNSGSIQCHWKTYNMQRDTFMVPKLVHDGNGNAQIRLSIIDKDGWEIASR